MAAALMASPTSESFLLSDSEDVAGSSHQRRNLTSNSSHPSTKTFGFGSFIPDDSPEDDDELHAVEKDGRWDKGSHGFSWRGVWNVATLVALALSLLMLFLGYPVLSHFDKAYTTNGGFNLGGTNGSGQVPDLPIRALIDGDTEDQFKTIQLDGQDYNLVFSDEFNQPGRTFWPGDDPFWEAVDMHYAATGDYEWYSPEAVNTSDGALLIVLEEVENHNLNFRSGMVQSWNKFCFQGGYVEFSVKQPGKPNQQGYWPAAWLMGNLGRAGYLATTEGTWPYSYQGCDTGILENQTFTNGSGPYEALHSDAQYAASNGQISTLPGMRYPSCTCEGEDHPGPKNAVGRSAPEIDVMELQFQNHDGEKHIWASQSFQTAPFDKDYAWGNDTDQATVHNSSITEFNSYNGSPYQECVSSITQTPDNGFWGTEDEFVTMGLSYSPDWDGDGSGSITWYIDGKKTWTLQGSALGASTDMDISQRQIPTEPMYIIMNLGISSGFQWIDFDQTSQSSVQFPAKLAFDYVRVYQPKSSTVRVGCDPKDHPTADFIARHPEPYNNPNLTRWSDTVYDWPKNRIKDGC
ncbi:concanavalin A-like lectin/glucanase [Violaceomyces palustris]|uniref:Concanavalin A-like lectin/glucanase n=1 Tax=Violaceomyces palustris TaxID=1673888 RepID=A0ACD0NX45_9BASI|nr:concanavalin A-like lectin/glucanase [Violaceomyces palustris]